ncbi:MAG: ATP-binding protein [Planctomycetota bacterium]
MSDEPVRILVVDDELGMREGCRKILTAEGFEVETAADGMAGLEIFEKRRNFAAALIDMKMPRMDGVQLIEKIRQQNDDIVLLVITAYATIETAVEATKRGAYGYIPKPFTPDELLLAVRNGLERRELILRAKRLQEERERRMLEVAYERSQSKTIINCMTDGVIAVNREGQIVLQNTAASRVVAECCSVDTPAPLSALKCEELAVLLRDALHAASGPAILSKEIRFGESTYMVNTSSVREPSGETIGAVSVLRDITARKKLEEEKSMFVSMVAHEIKSPLAAIENYLNVILGGMGGDVSEKARKMLDRSLARTQALRQMVADLMGLTAIETGRFTIKRVSLDVAAVAAAVVEECKENADAKQIQLSFEKPGDIEPALADRDAIHSIVKNLVDNAIKYTPNGGHVNVRLEHNGMYVRVVVKDDGIGMTEEEKGKIFEEFYRAKNEYTAYVPGTGLGLSLVKRLVEMHQGRIIVQTAVGRGSTFSVSLPILESAAKGTNGGGAT